MTPFLLLYYVLLVIWLPLPWLALKLRGWARVALLVVAGCGLAAAVYEARLWAGTMPSIRLDIPLISVALGGLYGFAALVLFRARRPKAAGASGCSSRCHGHATGRCATDWCPGTSSACGRGLRVPRSG